jgi:Fe2+ transport system protein B
MHETILISGRDSLLVAIPFVFILFLSVFRLDETLARPRPALARPASTRAMNETGASILHDPDGRPVAPRRPNKQSS